jgi:hypothetical protein
MGFGQIVADVVHAMGKTVAGYIKQKEYSPSFAAQGTAVDRWSPALVLDET